jgi:Zn-dependent protease
VAAWAGQFQSVETCRSGRHDIAAWHFAANAVSLPGCAKPVPVNFQALRNPRRDMMLVAAAGPAMNIALAVVAALAFHIVGYLPLPSGPGLPRI